MLKKYALRSKISLDEEEQDKINKHNQTSHEINRSATRFNELVVEFLKLTDKIQLDNIGSESQKRIIEIADEMDQVLKPEKIE